MTGILEISRLLIELGLGETVTAVERAQCLAAISQAEGMVRRHLGFDPALATRTEFYPQRVRNTPNATAVWEVTDTIAYVRNQASGAGEALFLRHTPIRSIAQLYVDYDARSGTQAGAFGAGTARVEGTDFWANYDGIDSDGNKICKDGILRSHGMWPTEPGTVKIVYTAGYSPAELAGQDAVIDASPISQAVLVEATRLARRSLSRRKHRFAGFTAGSLQSESLGDYSYSLGSPDPGSAYGQGTISAEAIQLLSEFVNYGYRLAG